MDLVKKNILLLTSSFANDDRAKQRVGVNTSGSRATVNKLKHIGYSCYAIDDMPVETARHNDNNLISNILVFDCKSRDESIIMLMISDANIKWTPSWI